MVVYCTTNLINGKKYIGRDLRNNPKYLGSGKLFRAAIKKYGKENFEKEILCYAQDNNDLNELEKYYIDYYNAQKSDLFYNITSGGEGGITSNQSIKKKKILQYDLEGNFIREWDSAVEISLKLNILRNKIVSACTKYKSYKGFLWKRKGDTKNLKHIKRNDWCKKKVKLLDNNNEIIKIFNSITEMSKELKIDRSKIFKYFKNTNQNNSNYFYKI